MQPCQLKGEFKMSSSTFSTILQTLRKEKKVTQEQLAGYLGVSPQAVSKWENGSYPEGDLLPRIADYFSVSIDYLYGREEKDCPFEQKALDYFREGIKKELDTGKHIPEQSWLWEKLYDVIWAAQISPWAANKDYYGRMISEEEGASAASVMFNNEGYSYMNLDKGNEFYLLLKNSRLDGGFAHWMKHSGKVRDLFKTLSDEDNVRILLYLYTLAPDEYANVDTIAVKTGVAKEKVEKLIEYMLSDISEENVWKYMMSQIKIANESGKSDIAYGIDLNLAGLMFGLFTIADTLVHNPHGYNMQIANRSKAWIDWDSVK